MAETGSDILFLADRLTGRDEIRALRGLIVRLEQAGHSSEILCLSSVPDHDLGDLTECPGLGRRWQRPWAVRGLDLRDEPGHRRIMHVLSSGMAEAGLEIAERWRIPYLLGVDDFPHRETRFRLSRSWCRGLVVSNGELAGALVRDFGIPRRSIHPIARGIEGPARVPDETGSGTLRVPDETGSGTLDSRVPDPVSSGTLKSKVPDPFSTGTHGPSGPAESGRVPVIGAAGPLVASSGFTTFLNAARKVIDLGLDAEFLISGQGEDEGDLRRRAERLRIAERLTFADDLPVGLSFWDVLDVFCQTSVVPTVGGPLLLAMASAVPSIASDVEGLRRLVEDGESGLIVPPGDAGLLARSIVELLRDRDRARRMGESGRRRISLENDPDREAAQLDALYRRVEAAGLGPRDSGLARRIEGLDGRDAGPDVGWMEMAALPWLSTEP